MTRSRPPGPNFRASRLSPRGAERFALATRSAGLLALAGVAARPAAALDVPKGVNAAEFQAFHDTLDRFNDRMRELQADAATIVDQHQKAEEDRIESIYGTMLKDLREQESKERKGAIARLESFLRKYPVSPYSADMKYRLADLYFETSELEYATAFEEYTRLQDAANAHPEIVISEPPSKDYGRSMTLYKDIIANNQDYDNLPEAYYMLAWCYNAAASGQYDPEEGRRLNETIVSRYSGTAFANDANMMLGEYWFELPGPRSNPVVNVPTAISYYQTVLKDGPTGRNYDKAIYKLGWSNYKLNNYDAALSYMVDLLDYSDKLFLQTGKPSNMRPEAIKYLAISYADIGFNQAKRPVDIAVAHMGKVGDRPWQHEELETLADILGRQAKYEEAIDVWAYLQTKWPLDPKNPVYQYNIAQSWMRTGIPDPAKSDAAMSQLSEVYREGGEWYVANRTNPDAIAVARGYIETSLAAVAGEIYMHAQETGDVKDYAAAAEKYREFLEKYPFGADYNDDEWYYASALYASNQFEPALLAYDQVLKNDHSPYRDPARYQILLARRQIVEGKYGKLTDVPPGQTVERTVTSAFDKAITVYTVSDEQKSFIAACDDVVDRQFTDADTAAAVEKLRAAYLYTPGQIYFNHGNYDEARARFNKVIERYPATQEAGFAAGLLVQTYVNEGDLERVATLIDELKAKHLGEGGSSDALAKLGNVQEQAVFNLAQAMADKGKHTESSQAYLSFLTRFPESQYLNLALYNAANQADIAGQGADAIKLFERYVTQYPDDLRSKDLYFRIAETYSATLELDKAIGYYTKLYTKFPDHQDAANAMYNAAFLMVGTGNHQDAAKRYELYASTFKDRPDAEDTYWRAGEQWDLVSEADGLSFYKRYLDRFGATQPNHAIEALYKIATAQEKKGDRQAAATWARLQDTFRTSNGALMSQHTRSLAAEGAVKDLQKQFETLKTVKWTTSEEKNVEIITTTMPNKVKAFSDQAVDIITTYQDYDSSAAAQYFIGMSRFVFADMLYDVPPPKGLSEEELDVYRATVDERFRLPTEDAGRKLLQAALDKSKNDKRWSAWNSKALTALNERFPSDFPSERVESRGAIDPGDVPLAGPTSEIKPKEEPTP